MVKSEPSQGLVIINLCMKFNMHPSKVKRTRRVTTIGIYQTGYTLYKLKTKLLKTS